MIDLKEVSGLPLKFDEKKNILIFGEGLKQVIPGVRTHREMIPVLMDRNSKAPDDFYLMYRDVHLESDGGLIREHELRFDITIIPPGIVGKEFIKTAGHYHPKLPGKNITYPEVYGVLYGSVRYLLQKGAGKKVEDFVVVHAKEGDKVMVLPDYGHVTVNIGQTPVVMCNWVSARFKSEYGLIKACNGFAYYDTVKGFVKNKKYLQIPKIKALRPRLVEEAGLTKNPLYSEGIKNIGKLDYLHNPDKYPEIFKRVLI